MFSILNMAKNSWNGKIFCIFLMKNAHLLKILLYNPIFSLFQMFLELFFTPKNTPPKVKISKLDKRWDAFFLGHPVDIWTLETIGTLSLDESICIEYFPLG